MCVQNLVPIGPQATTCIPSEGYTHTHTDTLSYICRYICIFFKIANRVKELTVVFWVLHDSDVEERRLDPLQRHRHIADGVQHNLSIQVLNQMVVETGNTGNIPFVRYT